MKSSTQAWYVYVILCENRVLFSGITTDVNRRLKEQFSGGKRTSEFLLKNRPLFPIKKFKCRSKKLARQASERINQLTTEEKEDFILTAQLKNQPPFKLVKTSKNNLIIYCNSCGFTSTLKRKHSDLGIEWLKFECIHEIIKEKINTLFEQVILGAICFHNGRFIFEGKQEDLCRDFLLGFSHRGHRKRTMSAYETLDEISFKNSYLLLSAILEESFCIIKEYADQYSGYKLPEKYTRSTFKHIDSVIQQKRCKLRFRKIVQSVQLIANVLKHTGGIIKDEESGRELIRSFKLKKDSDIVAFRNSLKIGGVKIGNIFDIIIKLYVYLSDLIAFIFDFKKFRIKPSDYQTLLEKIVNYDVRETYKDFLKEVEKDGSVSFTNL